MRRCDDTDADRHRDLALDRHLDHEGLGAPPVPESDACRRARLVDSAGRPDCALGDAAENDSRRTERLGLSAKRKIALRRDCLIQRRRKQTAPLDFPYRGDCFRGRGAVRLDAAAEQTDLGGSLRNHRDQRLPLVPAIMGQALYPLPFRSHLLGLFRASDADARFPERPLVNDVAAFSLHAVGAIRNGRSRSESEDGEWRIEDGTANSSLSSILHPLSSHWLSA